MPSPGLLNRLGIKVIDFDWWVSSLWFSDLIMMGKDRHLFAENQDEIKNNTEVHPYLAGVVRFHIIQAVMDSHRNALTDLGFNLSPLVLRHQRLLSISCPKSQNNILVDCQYAYRIVKGHLLLKTEKILYPQVNGDKSVMEAVKEARTVFEHDPALNYRCRHKSWVESWPTVFKSPAEHLGPSSSSAFCASPMPVCLWTHTTQRVCQEPFNNFTPKACRVCHTDSWVGFVDLQLKKSASGMVPRACYLTTWKDVGCGKSILEQEWQSHFASEKTLSGTLRNIFPTSRLRDNIPTIHKSYEGTSSPRPYRSLSSFSLWSKDVQWPDQLFNKSANHQSGVMSTGGVEYCTTSSVTPQDYPGTPTNKIDGDGV